MFDILIKMGEDSDIFVRLFLTCQWSFKVLIYKKPLLGNAV
ncbi:Uncharacterised protein [Chlamydia trachomatis]|nr:Uncharacterised protein [Chlamydia trachomatis]